MEPWTWLAVSVLVTGLTVVFVHLLCFRRPLPVEAFEDGAGAGTEVEVDVDVDVGAGAEAEAEAGARAGARSRTTAAAEAATGGEAAVPDAPVQAEAEAEAPDVPPEAASRRPGDEDREEEEEEEQAPDSERISLGEAQWAFGRLGFTTVTVPLELSFEDSGPGSGEGSSVLRVEVSSPGLSTFVSTLEMGGVPAAKRTTGRSAYEFTVGGAGSGEIKLTQSEQQAGFTVRAGYRGERSSRFFAAPGKELPPEDAASPNVGLGEAKRVGRQVRVPFTIRRRSKGVSSVRVLWSAPDRSTFFERVEQQGTEARSQARSASATEWEAPLLPGVKGGVVVMQQSPGAAGAPAFTLWVAHGEDVTAVRVPADASVSADSAGDRPTLPPTVTPVLDTVQDMVDLDAFPHLQRQPVQTRVVESSPRIELEIPTAEKVEASSEGHVLRVPFRLRFAEGEAPEGTALRVTWQLDPATTQLRSLSHGGEEVLPGAAMEDLDAFEAVVEAPTSRPSVLVFDQPHGRRAIRLELSYAGERATVMLAGSADVARGAGFIGQKKPVDFDGSPQPRFTDVHESAEQRVSALYRTATGTEADEQTTKFLMSKFFEWQGDMARLANLVSTISTVVSADPDDDEAAAVQMAVAALEAGATPGRAKESLRNWKEYETHRAMWRPDQNAAGYPGASALKRPWADEAIRLSEGHSSDMAAVAANASDFEVAPGESSGMVGQGHWMF